MRLRNCVSPNQRVGEDHGRHQRTVDAISERVRDVMRTVTRRISKLEDCVWPAAGKPVLLLVLCQAGWGLALDQDRCIEILGESEFLPTDPVGLVNLLDVPEGLNAKFNPTNQRNNKL